MKNFFLFHVLLNMTWEWMKWLYLPDFSLDLYLFDTCNRLWMNIIVIYVENENRKIIFSHLCPPQWQILCANSTCWRPNEIHSLVDCVWWRDHELLGWLSYLLSPILPVISFFQLCEIHSDIKCFNFVGTSNFQLNQCQNHKILDNLILTLNIKKIYPVTT
jgi:hypothetical protein